MIEWQCWAETEMETHLCVGWPRWRSPRGAPSRRRRWPGPAWCSPSSSSSPPSSPLQRGGGWTCTPQSWVPSWWRGWDGSCYVGLGSDYHAGPEKKCLYTEDVGAKCTLGLKIRREWLPTRKNSHWVKLKLRLLRWPQNPSVKKSKNIELFQHKGHCWLWYLLVSGNRFEPLGWGLWLFTAAAQETGIPGSTGNLCVVSLTMSGDVKRWKQKMCTSLRRQGTRLTLEASGLGNLTMLGRMNKSSWSRLWT